MPVIPLAIEPDAEVPGFASIQVDATVGGRPHRLRLDTGAARTRLNATDGIELLPPVGADTSHSAFGARTSEPLVRVTDLVVGPIQIEPVDVVRSATSRAELLGLDVLGRHCLHFRFGAGVLEVDPPQSIPAGRDIVRGDRGHIYVDVDWRATTAQACWDTGASATVVDTTFWRRHRDLFAPAGTSAGEDAAGNSTDAPLLVMAEAVIGGRRFEPHLVVSADLAAVNRTVDRPMDLILGYPTLSQADWLFDLPRNRWSLTR